jgi:ribosomal-protein-alanine N-acetyltransferase
MTPAPLAAALARLHAAAFATPWDESAFGALLAQSGVFAEADEDGFILCRVVADEAEILTVAVHPDARRGGVGTRLVRAAARRASAGGAARLFLEVADDNVAARALYDRAGFVVAGRRKGYYARDNGPRADALIMSLDLP